ncbi:MAG: hypothetical protein ACXVLQ_06605 [Bacteriovorax sp.]
MKIILFTLTILLLASSVVASDLCVCQTGNSTGQVPFFKAGCKAWLLRHSCENSVIDSIDNLNLISESIKKYENVKSVSVGYVGHWGGSGAMVNYIKEQIVPAIIENKKINSIKIDNTACSAGDNPFKILKFLNSIDSFIAKKIQYFANQAISLGEWDSFVPQKTNLWSLVDGAMNEAIFPRCEWFLGQTCSGTFQKNEMGVCQMYESKEYKLLKCSNEDSFLSSWKFVEKIPEIKKEILSPEKLNVRIQYKSHNPKRLVTGEGTITLSAEKNADDDIYPLKDKLIENFKSKIAKEGDILDQLNVLEIKTESEIARYRILKEDSHLKVNGVDNPTYYIFNNAEDAERYLQRYVNPLQYLKDEAGFTKKTYN